MAPASSASTYVVGREDDLDFLSPEYRELFDRSSATLFQHPVWLDRLYRTLAVRQAADRLVVTVRLAADGGPGALVGVLPLVRRRQRGVRRVEFADLGVCDYAAPVLDRDHSVALLADPALAGGVRAALGPFDLLRIERLAGSGAELATLVGARVTRRHSYDTHVIELPTSITDWEAGGLDPGLARHLERKRKRLRPKGGVTLRLVTDAGEVDALMDLMRSFRRDRFAERRAVDLVQDPDCFDFYRDAARDGILRGGPTRLAVLDVGGEPAAVALDLADSDRHLFLLVGYDVARLRNYALGLLIVDELIRTAIADGLRTFDLTVGNEPYKRQFGARATSMHAVRVAATLRGQATAGLQDLDAAGRRAARRALALRARLADHRAQRQQEGPATS